MLEQFAKTLNIENTGGRGFIVSHKNFDGGKNMDNYYNTGLNESLTITGLYNNASIRLTFLFFQLQNVCSTGEQSCCDDYVEIYSIREYAVSKRTFCGYENLTNKVIDVYPISNELTITFITRSNQGSAGFLIKYEGNLKLILNHHFFHIAICNKMLV